MAVVDNQGRGMSVNTVLALNLGYLGLSGMLFLAPAGLALAALAAALVLSHAWFAAGLRTR